MWKVYKITCKIYHKKAECYKSYIGITINTVEERFVGHCASSNKAKFGFAIRKYGKDNWTLEILEDNIKTEKEALEKETFYIEKYNTLIRNNKGYNVIKNSNGREIINGKLECTGPCNLWKPVEKFSKNKNLQCGYGQWCKDCRREYNSKNLEHDRLRNQKYREENPEIVASFRANYKEIKKEKDKAGSKRISNENRLLSIDELRQRIPNKYCHNCKITQKTTQFNRRNSNVDGLYSWCKECVRKKGSEYHSRKKNKNDG